MGSLQEGDKQEKHTKAHNDTTDPQQSRLLNLLLRLVAFLLFLNPQCLASISRWITASSSWKRFCLFVCRALSSIMVICMLTAIRLLLTFVMSLYLLLR